MDFNASRAVLEGRWRTLGFDTLLPEERAFIVLWWLEAEVFNGGFHQYFFNSAGDAAPEALVALKSLGAVQTARVLADAIDLLGAVPYIRDNERRRKHLRALENSIERFDRVTDELQDLPEDFVSLAMDRVRQAYDDRKIAS